MKTQEQKDSWAAYIREYRKKNTDKVREWERQKFQRNKEKIYEQRKKYAEHNKEYQRGHYQRRKARFDTLKEGGCVLNRERERE